MSGILRTVNLSKRYRRTLVLDRMNLEVPEGSVYGLVGANGTGKTTTIKILMNTQQPTSGQAEIMGNDSRRLSPETLAQIGYVSENQLIPDWMTVGYFMSYLKPFYPKWDDAHAAELLRQFDLPLDRKLRHLSHGMRMKAALASALAYRPRLIILDEPFTGLDPLVRDEVVQGVLDNAAGATILISSHDLAEIESFASHIGYLEGGRLHFSEEMSTLNDRFREIEITLSQPAAAKDEWPATWVNREHSSQVIRFVDTQYEKDHTLGMIRDLFSCAERIAVNPMPLRAIFIALAKAGRKAA